MKWIPLICIVILIAIIVIWFISTQRKLVVLDENVNNAMSQIGVQMTSRFDALNALLDLTKGYAKHESETLIQTVNARKATITASSTGEQVEAQEAVFSEALGRISVIAEQYPDLKASENYKTTMNSVNEYENKVRQSRMIYNDCVTKINRSIRMFPTSLIAGMLGFSQKQYLETPTEKQDMPNMK